MFVYAVNRRGYRAGGNNSPTLAGRLIPFQSSQPEMVIDVKAGIRSDFRAGDVRLRLNASPFIGWFSNLQVPVSGLNTQATCSTVADGGTLAPLRPDGDCSANIDPSGNTLVVNAESTRVAVVDFSARIAPRSNLTFEAGATFLDLNTRSLTVPTNLQPYLRVLAVPFNLVAEQTFTARVRWTLPVSESIGNVDFSGDYYNSSSVQSSDAVLPAFDLVNACLDLGGIGGSRVGLTIFVRNLFDKKYLASRNVGSNLLVIQSGFFGAPRMVGVELHHRIGS